jgi:hypothetical protein
MGYHGISWEVNVFPWDKAGNSTQCYGAIGAGIGSVCAQRHHDLRTRGCAPQHLAREAAWSIFHKANCNLPRHAAIERWKLGGGAATRNFRGRLASDTEEEFVRRPVSRVLYRLTRKRGGDDHSSSPSVAERLKQPTRTAARKRACGPNPLLFLFGLAPGGVCRAAPVTRRAVRSYRTVSPLPTVRRRRGGLFSVALSLESPPPGVTRHRASVEPGLSSPHARRRRQRSSGRLTVWR